MLCIRRVSTAYLFGHFTLGHIEIINSPKDLDPQIVTWKGAAILAGLESSNELWITGKEWSSWSVRILKERAMFNW
jgi:actin-related protein 8